MPKYTFTEEQEQEIIDFYLVPNSLKETTKHFGFINISVIKKVLKKYNIPFHNSNVYRKIQVDKSKKTNLEKYGVEFPAQCKKVKEKAKQTCMQKYGVQNGGGSQQAIEKIKIAYWTKDDAEKESIKNKRKATNLEKYGYKSTGQVPEFKKQIEQTCLNKYGVTNGGASKEAQEKIKATNLKKYGVESTFQAEEIKEKIKQTNLERYGMPSYTQTEKYRNNLFEKYGAYHAPTNRYKYKNQYFDSFPELCLYMYCLENNIPIIREPIELTFDFDEKTYHYYPDFKINDELIEVKGKQFLTEDGSWCNPFDHSLDRLFEAKHQCALANNVKILYEQEYKKYINWFNEKGYKKEDYLIKNIV